ncbi:unnamed protein product [Pedinophyceae sp. YPF-701]|nr:unnamed protein product [Pedinophyceae sp. YPF-701]
MEAYVVDGRACAAEEVGASKIPAEMLRSSPEGVYTSFLLWPSGEVHDRQLHRERLALSMLAVAASAESHPWNAAVKELLAHLSSSHGVCCCHPPIPKSSLLARSEDLRKVSGWPSLHSALWSDLVLFAGIAMDRSIAALPALSADTAPLPPGRAKASTRKCVVVFEPASSDSRLTPWSEASPASPERGAGRPLAFCPTAAADLRRDDPNKTTAPQMGVSVRLLALAPEPADPAGATASAPMRVVTVQSRRRGPTAAKYCDWARERTELRKLQEVDEVLMCAGDAMLEGLVSNFFIVESDPTRARLTTEALATVCRPDVPPEARKLRLRTAGVADGALPGVVRGRVMAECAAAGVPVVVGPPELSSLRKCHEAFLCNAYRGVAGLAAGGPPGHVEAVGGGGRGVLTEWLQNALRVS